MEVLSTVTLLPKSKNQVESYFNQFKREMLSGSRSLLEIKAHLKAYSDIIKAIDSDDDIRNALMNEAEKFGTKSFEYSGTKFQIREKTDYDYSECGDTKLNELNSDLIRIKEEIKARENWIRTFKDITPDPTTGELINPPKSIYSTSLAVTLK